MTREEYFKDKGKIRLGERDNYLKQCFSMGLMNNELQNGRVIEGWDRYYAEGLEYFHRTFQPIDGQELWESIIPFPSAPIYGINRKHEYQHKLDRINFHTFRLIRRKAFQNGKPSQIKHLYLIHNGLNETEFMHFYYTIADQLIQSDDSACLIRPLPGHLTRYPLIPNFSEKPLDRYLSDSGDLFRQFLRYMMETHWLLSILVPNTCYRVVSGLELLAESQKLENGDYSEGRANHQVLSDAIFKYWQAAYNSTRGNVDHGPGLQLETIKSSIETIRHLIGWKPYKNVSKPSDNISEPNSPIIHAVGYSLGGFVAQSVFFAWPYAVSSCTTLCSGGALRDVAPTVFAHPEEWQAVMYTLRYEIESSMVDERLKYQQETESIIGIKVDYFNYFYRIFYEIFLQDFSSSYKSRVSEYVSRMLFIVGGNDPIVRPQAVLDASPPGGINLLEIANLKHFLGFEKTEEWRTFWLPEVIRLIGSLSKRTGKILCRTLHESWLNENLTYQEVENIISRNRSPQVNFPGREAMEDLALSNPKFQIEISSLVNMLNLGGWVLMLRNKVPTMCLGPNMLYLPGTNVNFAEGPIKDYIIGVAKRNKTLLDNRERVVLDIPKKAKEWFEHTPAVFSPNGETPRASTILERRKIWEEFYKEWQSRILFFDTDKDRLQGTDLGNEVKKTLTINEDVHLIINTLPDVLIGLSSDAASDLIMRYSRNGENEVGPSFVEWATRIVIQKNDPKAESFIDIEEWLRSEKIRIIKVSAAQYNLQFRGWRVLKTKTAKDIIIHSALTYQQSVAVSSLV